MKWNKMTVRNVYQSRILRVSVILLLLSAVMAAGLSRARPELLRQVTHPGRSGGVVVLAPGAEEPLCRADYLVVLDPGHGGIDRGANVGELDEKTFALAVTVKAQALLEDAGCRVLLTRDGDETVDYKERIRWANNRKASLFVSVHGDSFTDQGLSGAQSMYSPDNASTLGGIDGKKLARTVEDAIIASTGAVNRGIKDRPDLAVLRLAEMPATLVEAGFISNPEEAARLADDGYQQKLAAGISDGVLKIVDDWITTGIRR